MSHTVPVTGDAFVTCLASGQSLLAEGSVFERLRRTPGLVFDPDLAHAALIYDARGAVALESVHREYIEVAAQHALPIVCFTDTWRANADRLARSAFADRDVNGDCVRFLGNLRRHYGRTVPIFLGGLMGCRGDAYKPAEALDSGAAFTFHAPQIEALAATEIDFLFAATLPAVSEALGIARRMALAHKPYILSFVIRPDGTVLDGTPLPQAIAAIDREVRPRPTGYYVNCVHPTVMLAALKTVPFGRVLGLQGNTSKRPPEEIDGAAELDTQDPAAFARDMWAAVQQAGLAIAGGCCGTDTRHIAALASLLSAGGGAKHGT